MSSVITRRSRFGLSIGSIFAAFIMIGGIQVLIASVRPPLSAGAVQFINWTMSKAPLHAGPTQWSLVIENLVTSALFIACGLGLGSWLRRDPR